MFKLYSVAAWTFAFAVSTQAACDACLDFQTGVRTGTVSTPALTEASGIAASARNPGVLWTHNDGSNGKIFALGTNAALLATFNVSNVDDLEDIAVGPGPTNGISYLYLGDIGGSTGTNALRSSVRIVRVPEPAVDLAWASNPRSPGFGGRETFTLVYPDGSYDAETLLVDPLTADLFVVTKQVGGARLYRANLNSATNGSSLPLTFLSTIFFNLASGGDISADGTQIVLRREDFARIWPRCDGQSVQVAMGAAGQTIPVIGPPNEPNGEGFAFLRDGTGYVTISEGANPDIYFFRAVCPVAPRFTLSVSNQSVFVGGSAQFRSAAVGYPDPVYSWFFNGGLIAGQNSSVLELTNVNSAAAGQYQVVAANANGRVTNSASLSIRAKPDLRITEVLSSAAASPGVPTSDWWELTSFETQPVNLSGWRLNDNGGGLADPFVIPAGVSIAPGESIIFAEGLTAAQFVNWWGATNLPDGLQIITYSGAGLSLSANGDGLRLWDSTTTDAADTVASVDFGVATAGVTFTYNPDTQTFGGTSQLGVNGAIRAAAATDVGSPGRIRAPATSPILSVRLVNQRLRIEFEAVAGRVYSLEESEELVQSAWGATGDTLQVNTSGLAFFETDATAPARFFRVSVR